MELVSGKKLLYKVNKHQCNLFTMCSFLKSSFTVIVNNNIINSEIRIGNGNFHWKLPIIQINSISLIESEQL